MARPSMFRLDQNPASRGLRCDGEGLFLSGDVLLDRDDEGNFFPRPPADLRKILASIYGNDGDWESRIRSVALVAKALNKGDMARATMTAVLMRLPDPDEYVRISDVDGVLAKAGFNPDEPRDERGRWTDEGSFSGVEAGGESRDPRTQLADAGMSDAADNPAAEAARAAVVAARRTVGEGTNDNSPFDEFPKSERKDAPHIVLAAAEGEDEKDQRLPVGNHPPPEELIPQKLQRSPAGPAVQVLENLLDVSELADEANLQGTRLLQMALLQGIREVDPHYVYQNLQRLEDMSWQGRRNTIYGLQANLAAAIYRVRRDIKPLQEVTLDFMQRTANATYDDCLRRYRAGELNARMPPQLALGNCLDGEVRRRLRQFYNGLGISTNTGSPIRVNRRAYDSSDSPPSYRVPDARVGDLAFDISLEAKKPSKDQIRDIFSADFKPTGVVIVRPNQLGDNSSYVIWRREGD